MTIDLFFMERESARTVVVHQQELLKQFLQCSVLALHFLLEKVICDRTTCYKNAKRFG